MWRGAGFACEVQGGVQFESEKFGGLSWGQPEGCVPLEYRAIFAE